MMRLDKAVVKAGQSGGVLLELLGPQEFNPMNTQHGEQRAPLCKGEKDTPFPRWVQPALV